MKTLLTVAFFFCAVIFTASAQTCTPAVTISTPKTFICNGEQITFIATPNNGGAAPAYQWQVNGNNVGSNDTIYVTTTLVDGDIVSCIMTSNAPCASPTTATSNSITMSVNTIIAGTISANKQTICQNTIAHITLAGNSGGSTLQWQSSQDSINGFTNIIGATGASYISGALTQTTYFRVVVSSGTCAVYTNVLQIEVIPSPVATFTWTVGFFGDVVFDGSASTGATSYLWDFGDGLTGTSASPVHTYDTSGFIYHVCLTVSNASGCNFTLCQNVPVVDSGSCDISVDSSQVTNATCGNNNGSIVLSGISFNGTVHFLWSNGSTNPSAGNLAAGVYTVTITDNTCSQVFTYTVNNSDGPQVTVTKNNVTCGNPFGNIGVTLTGGVPPYQYLWSNTATTSNIDSLTAGTYTLTVTDSNSCKGYASVTIRNNMGNFYVYTYDVPENCGNHQGSAIALVYGGTPPYNYSWSDPNAQTAKTATGLNAGIYNVTVSDSAGCVSSVPAFVGNYCVSTIKGKLFNDLNGNCTLDAGEQPIEGAYVEANDGLNNYYYGYSDSSGNYTIAVGATGTYTLHSNVSLYGSCGGLTPCGNTSATVSFSALGDSSTGNNFGFTGTTQYDLALHPGWSSANPGFIKEYWILYYNASPITFNGTATITFNYDPALIYDSSLAPLPFVDTVAHTLIWTVNNIPSGSFNWNDRLRNFFRVRVGTALNYQLQSTFSISPTTGDCDTSNNNMHFSETVTGSHDPNEKEVSPEGIMPYEDSVLTYTIRFQNTGNDTTNFVIVKDTLSPYLDAASVVNLASSTQYTEFDVSGKGILTWLFSPIYLVDSATNPSASKGFVTFKVKKRTGTPGATEIKNKSSIYFDYNEGVVTNTVSTTVDFPSAVRNISTNTQFAIYPNPSNGNVMVSCYTNESVKQISVTNTLGQLVSSTTINSSNKNFVVQLPAAAGLYFIHVRSDKGEYVGKVVRE